MEGHAALPDLEDLGGVGEVVGGLVEQNEAEAAAKDDPEDDPCEQVFKLWLGERRCAAPERGAAYSADADAPCDENADDIGERIPAQGKLHAADGQGEYLGGDFREGDLCQHVSRCCLP